MQERFAMSSCGGGGDQGHGDGLETATQREGEKGLRFVFSHCDDF